MSLTLSYFLPKPYYFKDRDVRPLFKSDIRSCDIDTDKIVSLAKFGQRSSKSGNIYTMTIELGTIENITSTTNVKVHCTCPNFKFQCASLLWKYEALYGDIEDRRLPKKQTKPFVCKHLYSAILLLNKLNTVSALKQIAGD